MLADISVLSGPTGKGRPAQYADIRQHALNGDLI
jgi:hypothetical protein